MAAAHSTSRSYKFQSAKQITILSLSALLLGHLMITTYVPNEMLNFVGLIITSTLIYRFTLSKNDFFSFVMVIYFCSTFPYLQQKGGGFNMVSFLCIAFYLFTTKKFPGELRVRDPWFKRLITLLMISSLLGWIFNYTGEGMDIVYSISTFFGIIFVLLLSGRLEITKERIKVFIQLNIVLIIYSLIASLNKFEHIITFNTPMMPVFGGESEVLYGGGLIGSGPVYGEYGLILLILFAIMFMLNKKSINIDKSFFLSAAFIALINIFISIIRSAFLLSLVGLAMVFILQVKLHSIKLSTIFLQIALLFLLGGSVLFAVNTFKLGFVFQRVSEIGQKNKVEGNYSLDRILDGSAFNREVAFAEGFKRYASKDTWLIGYGWGIGTNNRDAYYVDPNIARGTAHSQIFAVLFILGWIGFISYYLMLFRIIYRSYKTSGNKYIAYTNRLMALFFTIAFSLFVLDEIKADSINFPSYFMVTIIWMGLAFSVNNQGYKEIGEQ
jgi:hypothetical protein